MLYPLLVSPGGLSLAIILAVLVLVLVAVYVAVDGDEWGQAPRGTGGGAEETVCPRCHHRTLPGAAACPECGKSLSAEP
jgi:hypothetical protein